MALQPITTSVGVTLLLRPNGRGAGPACEGLRMPQVKELVDENGVFHGKTFDETDMHIVCPWHGYEFHLSDGYHVADRRLRLQKFDVIERDGEIYVAV